MRAGITFILALAISLSIFVSTASAAGEVNVCKNFKGTKFRLVHDPSQCQFHEVPVVWTHPDVDSIWPVSEDPEGKEFKIFNESEFDINFQTHARCRLVDENGDERPTEGVMAGSGINEAGLEWYTANCGDAGFESFVVGRDYVAIRCIGQPTNHDGPRVSLRCRLK